MKLALLIAIFIAAPSLAGTPDQEAALREITVFTARQAKSDPLYSQVEAEMLTKIDDIIAKQPPGEWAPTIRRMYFALAEKAHAAERLKIRDTEAEAIARGPTDPQAAWRARFEALDARMAAGELGPREHAMHTLEAAQLIMPDDRLLIALRRTKVSLATDYELGAITGSQYDERWSQARDRYYREAEGMQAAARAPAMDAAVMEQAAAAARAQAISDGFRRARGINCISRPGPLGATINCQ